MEAYQERVINEESIPTCQTCGRVALVFVGQKDGEFVTKYNCVVHGDINPVLRSAADRDGEDQRETDRYGKCQHEPGAKLDAGKNRLGLMLMGFAAALEEVGKVGTYGASKYSPNGWESVPDGVERYTDAMFQHLFAEKTEGPRDAATGFLHAAHAAWNALARLELMIRDCHGSDALVMRQNGLTPYSQK